MVELKRTDSSVRAERAVLIQIAAESWNRKNATGDGGGSEVSMEELRRLAQTARAQIVGELTQSRRRPNPGLYLGRGKVEELGRLCRRLGADLVICDDDLTPAQVRGLELALDLKVIDRSELILDIFATHARTHEARLQVELAQLEYAFPRLKKMWSHLDRVAGGQVGAAGGIGVRGPGERQLEMDRRLVQKRITDLKKTLTGIEAHHHRLARRRSESFTTVTLVGYTNAGKSTLMNALTGADVAVRDRLFETLDTRTREWALELAPGSQEAHGGAAGRPKGVHRTADPLLQGRPWRPGRRLMLSDTVGFIRKLPHHLVASFHATLEEAREADLLLHVADASSPAAEAQIESVQEVLRRIGCGDKPQILVLNKMDAARDLLAVPLLRSHVEHSVAISAARREGLDELTVLVAHLLRTTGRTAQPEVELVVEASLHNGRVVSLLHEHGEVLERTYRADGVRLRVRVPAELRQQIESMGARTALAGADSPAG